MSTADVEEETLFDAEAAWGWVLDHFFLTFSIISTVFFALTAGFFQYMGWGTWAGVAASFIVIWIANLIGVKFFLDVVMRAIAIAER